MELCANGKDRFFYHEKWFFGVCNGKSKSEFLYLYHDKGTNCICNGKIVPKGVARKLAVPFFVALIEIFLRAGVCLRAYFVIPEGSRI